MGRVWKAVFRIRILGCLWVKKEKKKRGGIGYNSICTTTSVSCTPPRSIGQLQINVSHLCECSASCSVPFNHTCLYLDVDLVWMSVALDLQSGWIRTVNWLINHKKRVKAFTMKYRWYSSLRQSLLRFKFKFGAISAGCTCHDNVLFYHTKWASLCHLLQTPQQNARALLQCVTGACICCRVPTETLWSQHSVPPTYLWELTLLGRGTMALG